MLQATNAGADTDLQLPRLVSQTIDTVDTTFQMTHATNAECAAVWICSSLVEMMRSIPVPQPEGPARTQVSGLSLLRPVFRHQLGVHCCLKQPGLGGGGESQLADDLMNLICSSCYAALGTVNSERYIRQRYIWQRYIRHVSLDGFCPTKFTRESTYLS